MAKVPPRGCKHKEGKLFGFSLQDQYYTVTTKKSLGIFIKFVYLKRGEGIEGVISCATWLLLHFLPRSP